MTDNVDELTRWVSDLLDLLQQGYLTKIEVLTALLREYDSRDDEIQTLTHVTDQLAHRLLAEVCHV